MQDTDARNYAHFDDDSQKETKCENDDEQKNDLPHGLSLQLNLVRKQLILRNAFWSTRY